MPPQDSTSRARIRALATMDDGAHVTELVKLGSTPAEITRIQALAAKTMADIGYKYPRKACAATLSRFLREAGIDVPITTGAQSLADRLRINRHWERVTVGHQTAGDVGVCFSMADDVPGADHVYLVVEAEGPDLMTIADNQAQGTTHQRYASGKGGKTPTEYFLRAPQSRALSLKLAGGLLEGEDVPDEPTDDLPEPFMDDGSPRLIRRDGSILTLE